MHCNYNYNFSFRYEYLRTQRNECKQILIDVKITVLNTFYDTFIYSWDTGYFLSYKLIFNKVYKSSTFWTGVLYWNITHDSFYV